MTDFEKDFSTTAKLRQRPNVNGVSSFPRVLRLPNKSAPMRKNISAWVGIQ
jgi:hypothetical protein